jgi:SAM-dependent methyltransferase
VRAFAEAGYEVYALDFSPAAVERARSQLPAELRSRVIEGDFFTHDFGASPFDVVYERTFLCALPPRQWPQIAQRTASLVKTGGCVLGLYYFGEKEDGPPFGCGEGEPDSIFGHWFQRTIDEAVPREESLPLFAGAERWQLRVRNALPADSIAGAAFAPRSSPA